MCAEKLDTDELEKIWKERATKLFEEFAAEFLGFDPGTRKEPLCYGSGDGSSYCAYCMYSNNC